ncbi:MAG TPA: tetratricopeptide repeat protein [Rhizobiales bacterium]|nr:tetratricopeptide repeat protein [Hyphomicrobiales bacterium]
MARRRGKSEEASQPAAPLWARLRESLDLPSLEKWTTTARTVVINALFLVAVIVVVPLLFSQFKRDQVIIEPIAVPETLSLQGLTPDVAASRVWDGLRDVAAKAHTSKEQIAAIPDSRQVEFSFPDSGFSIESLVFHLRRLFNAYETRISGEFVCADAACAREGMRLRLRVIRDGIDVIDLGPVGQRPERDYFAEAAAGVLSVLDPFVAIAAASQEEPFRATVLARRLIRSHHPDAKWAHNLIGRIRSDAGEDDAAIVEFRAAIALDPTFAVARANLGNTLIRKKDLAGARAEFEAIRRRDAGNVRAAEGFADIAAATGDRAEAVRLLIEAAELDPQSPRYFSKAGRLEMEAGNTAKAVKLLERALELDPGHLPAFALLGTMYMGNDDYTSAARIYRAAADYAPEDADAQASYGRIRAVLKEWEGALASYARAVALEPADAEYRYEYARALQELGRHEEALASLAEALRLDPAFADAYMSTGDSHRSLGNRVEAIAAYRKFLAFENGSPMRVVAERYIDLLTGAAGTPSPQAAKPITNLYAQ